jgi:hypothetical protein
MPDFLDRFGDQLLAAQAAPTALKTSASRRIRRGAWASLAMLLIAAPAVAVVQPWQPVLGRPEVDGPVTSDSSPVVAEARDALAVLRRPQTGTDREIAAPLLKQLSADTVGVQVAAIRALRDGWALVPVTRVEIAPGETMHDALCVLDNESSACGPASQVRTSGIGATGASETHTIVYGLVPDGVERVRFTPEDGKAVEAAVEDNFYVVRVPQVQPREMIRAPEGFHGPKWIPEPPRPVRGTVEWLDSAPR